MLVGQAGNEDVDELVGLLLAQRDHLVDGQADPLARDHVDIARQQIGLQRGGVARSCLMTMRLKPGLVPVQLGFGSSTICAPES